MSRKNGRKGSTINSAKRFLHDYFLIILYDRHNIETL